LRLLDQWDLDFLTGRGIGSEVDRWELQSYQPNPKSFVDERTQEKKGYSVKGIADEWEYSKSTKRKDGRLTSGTTKLMAISSRGRGSKTWKIGEGGSC